jgi:hypothetical protein
MDGISCYEWDVLFTNINHVDKWFVSIYVIYVFQQDIPSIYGIYVCKQDIPSIYVIYVCKEDIPLIYVIYIYGWNVMHRNINKVDG